MIAISGLCASAGCQLLTDRGDGERIFLASCVWFGLLLQVIATGQGFQVGHVCLSR